MEEVLEPCAIDYDPQHPVLCVDEQPVQLLKETEVPIAATKSRGKRVDYEYERNGTAREHRTKQDWAVEVAHLLDARYANCKQVTFVLDNLNTHTKGA